MAQSDDRHVQQEKQASEVLEGPSVELGLVAEGLTHPTDRRRRPRLPARRPLGRVHRIVRDRRGNGHRHGAAPRRRDRRPQRGRRRPRYGRRTGGLHDVLRERVQPRGRLQRAQKINSLYPSREYVLPLPPKAGGEFGQAPVYNTEVDYDAQADEWRVTDDTFTTGTAIYLANQEVWISNWSGGFYHGRAVPGQTDEPIS